MARHIFLCPKCKEYTMEKVCKKCSSETSTVKPPKYSPDYKYDGYRRQIKEEERKSKGLI